RALSLAALFAVHRGQLPAREPAHHRLVVEPVSGLPDPVDPRRLPRHVLLLPEGLLPVLLRIAPGLRRAGLVEDLFGRDPLPVCAAEHPPLLLLALPADPRVPLVRRDPRVRLPRALRHGRRHAGAADQRLDAHAVLAVMPFVPPLVRRPPRRVLE